MLSPDGLTLYVTNNTSVVAFDVRSDGSTTNRRDFAVLNGDNGGDGMAVDAVGRLYVTANKGIHILSADGKYLGLIPTPRRPISLAFSGPNKKTLYVPMLGAVGPNGKEWTTPEGVRNTAMTYIQRRRPKAEVDWSENPAEPSDHAPGPETQLLQEERRRRVRGSG